MIKKFNKGFSLIELLVVISIIGILLAVLVANFMGARERAKDAQKIQDMSSLKSALRMYYNDNQAYPTGTPGQPLNVGFSGYYPGVSGLGYTYSYYQTSSGDGFNLCVQLDNGGGDDDILSQKKCGSATIGVCNQGVGTTTDKLFAVCTN